MILLDTHIWIRWLLPDDPLPDNLTKLIMTADDALAVSSISCWEVVLLERFQRIKLPFPVEEWLTEALSGSDVTVLPLDENIASLAGGVFPIIIKIRRIDSLLPPLLSITQK